MKLIERYRGKKKAESMKLPYTVERLWLAGCYAFKNKQDNRTVHMPYFYNKQYVEHSLGQIVPLFKTKLGTAYYRILDIQKYPGSDPAMFDDQREYDLVFHHFEKKEQL